MRCVAFIQHLRERFFPAEQIDGALFPETCCICVRALAQGLVLSRAGYGSVGIGGVGGGMGRVCLALAVDVAGLAQLESYIFYSCSGRFYGLKPLKGL